MNLVQHYLRRAEECRKLAVETNVPGHRKAIEAISDRWLKLADERLKHLKNAPPRDLPKRDLRDLNSN
jgi:hypothetical protein